MNLLFLFLDGVGLGPDDPKSNPFAAAALPNLARMLDGHRLTAAHPALPLVTAQTTWLALDACLGVDGRPQSASGQATLLTGKNIPQLIGEHYGPKPNAKIREILAQENLFGTLKQAGYQASLLNAFPEAYFKALDSGRRLPGAIAMAARSAGIQLKTTEDLFNGEALSADFTAQGWRQHLNYEHTPVLTPTEAGARLAQLARKYDFTFFEYWLSDYAGHKRNMTAAQELLGTFDQVLGGLLAAWEHDQGLILITSDHGNLEDLTIRNHTRNPVPAILFGPLALRQKFAAQLKDLSDIAPAIIDFFAQT